MEEIEIRAVQHEDDRAWLCQLWDRQWGGQVMVSRGRLHRLEDLDAIIARREGVPLGAATYRLHDNQCEVTSLDATEAGSGTGSRLLGVLEQIARDAGCHRIWMITTNDNLDALRFYQRRGYRLAHVHRGAVDQARALKPSISEVGNYGIPIHDELELEKSLEDPDES